MLNLAVSGSYIANKHAVACDATLKFITSRPTPQVLDHLKNTTHHDGSVQFIRP